MIIGKSLSTKGFTLFELLLATLLLGMISAMLYSVLNVGIKFSAKGEKQAYAMERRQGFLRLLRRQVESAWYDLQQNKLLISAGDNVFRVVTRSPLIYRQAGTVLAVYRYNEEEAEVYYLEKRDFYNPDYDEEYVPDFEDMTPLVDKISSLAITYDPLTGPEVAVTFEDREYLFMPQSGLTDKKVSSPF